MVPSPGAAAVEFPSVRALSASSSILRAPSEDPAADSVISSLLIETVDSSLDVTPVVSSATVVLAMMWECIAPENFSIANVSCSARKFAPTVVTTIPVRIASTCL